LFYELADAHIIFYQIHFVKNTFFVKCKIFYLPLERMLSLQLTALQETFTHKIFYSKNITNLTILNLSINLLMSNSI